MDSFNQTFVTGASVCGQVRMADGSILENTAVYSHANYLANGDLTDRSTSDPVVTTTGNVTVKGNVFIQGDSAGTEIGQTALQVKDGTLTLEDGATLAAFGGDGNTLLYSQGGTAIKLDNGKITGSGKLIAIGGDVLFGDGGNAVEGNGTISTTEAFLQGSTAYGEKTPGKATDGTIKISSPKQSVKDGEQLDTGSDDPLADLYWKTGIDPMPPLDKYITEEVPIITYTVTYTDGVDDEVIFEDQVTTDLSDGDATPAFNGTPAATDILLKVGTRQLQRLYPVMLLTPHNGKRKIHQILKIQQNRPSKNLLTAVTQEMVMLQVIPLLTTRTLKLLMPRKHQNRRGKSY